MVFRSKKKKEKGTILIITLWILAILAVLAVGFAYRMSLELKLTGYQLGRLKVLYLAKAGIRKAILELEKDTNSYDTLQEAWSNNEKAFRKIKLGDGWFTVSYSLPKEDSEEKVVFYGMMDEERKININKASKETLEALFELVDEPKSTDIAASIVDWRDPDSKVEEGGAEDSYYRSLDKPYDCKNADFEMIEELLLVKGVTPKLLSKVRNLITIYGEGRVNINTAGKKVLQALGRGMVRARNIPEVDENTADNLAERIIRFREQGQTEKDEEYIFKDLNDIVNKMSRFEGGTTGSGENNLINALKPQLAVRSSNFKITVIASLNDGKVVKTATAIVARNSGQSTIIRYWHDN
ncbi:MAG: general secretion pathway protein GspK [Nitrospirae bacterium]|nr:general secretion pathway protein GspK [Nitrospirota bacterium]